jgi:flagellar basal body P-ring protein FlgI
MSYFAKHSKDLVENKKKRDLAKKLNEIGRLQQKLDYIKKKENVERELNKITGELVDYVLATKKQKFTFTRPLSIEIADELINRGFSYKRESSTVGWEDTTTPKLKDPDFFLSAKNMNWLNSKNSKLFIDEILGLIHIAANNGNSHIYVSFLNEKNQLKLTLDVKVFIEIPFLLQALTNFFECLGYKIKIDNENQSKSTGVIKISW